MSDDANFAHCEALVRGEDKDRFLASLFAPAAQRRHLCALYAFNLEVARVRALVREPMAGAIRLQWWRDAITGERAGEVAASPVAAALQATLAATRVDPAPLVEVIELRRAELFGEPASPADAGIFLTAARMLGGEGDTLAVLAHDAGLAYGWSYDLHHHAAARDHYGRFRAAFGAVEGTAKAAFLPAALVPLRLRQPDPPQWRRQVVLARAAWFGFPDL